ncbi:MAG: hypothetical protein V1707_00215 [bacterium]
MAYIHQELAAGRWQQLSLCEQLGNVGSEVHRAMIWKDKDKGVYNRTVERALELLDLTLADSKHKGQLKEIARARETVVDAYLGGKEYGSTWEGLDKYFMAFAVAARKGK